MLGGIALAAQAALGLGQAIFGGIKKKQAPDLPTYQIPSELGENLSQAEQLALQGLPEEQKQQYLENIQRSGVSALQQAGTRKAGLGLVSSIQQQQQDAYKELLSQDAGARMMRQRTVMQMRERIAEEKFRKHEADTMRSQILRGEADQMIGAGVQNIGGATGSAASLSSMFGGEELFNFGGSARKAKKLALLKQQFPGLDKISSIAGSVSL
jgi:hypothetical protein